MKNLITTFSLLFESFVLKKVFHSHYEKKRERRILLDRFPCPECRPDGCTFYWDIPCTCQKCGREYHI